MKKEYIGWDLTGCIVSPETITTKSGLEVSLSSFREIPAAAHSSIIRNEIIRPNSIKQGLIEELGEDVNVHWKRILDTFVEDYKKTSEKHGEDFGLARFLWAIDNNYGVTVENYQEGTRNLFEEGLVRIEVLDAMAELKNLGKINVIITKNEIKDVAGFAKAVNKHYGTKIIHDYIGSSVSSGISALGDRDSFKIMADNTGDMYIENLPVAVARVLKKDAVKKIVGNGILTGFVTDNGDKNIRESVMQNGGSAAIIQSNTPYELLDHYFQMSADKNGNYQQKTIDDGAFNDVLKYDSKLTENLVKMLG